MTLPEKLEKIKKEIRGCALKYGLDFFETIFEMIDFSRMNEIVSYDGFPIRYRHWRFGMEYEKTKKSYSYGLHKIYELVINNNPCYAYLLDCNSEVDQKIVIAHVYAHSDFFKNNMWFSKTNRKMVDQMANHNTRIRKYQAKHGFDTVESFIDCCLSIDNLIDYYSPFIKKRGPDEEEKKPKRLKSKGYMDKFINPPEFIEEQQKKITKQKKEMKRFPEWPERDILEFLVKHAPLEDWQRDVLSMVREEIYYFAPQRLTKVLNEGWAVFWHSKIMTEMGFAGDEGIMDYADHHSGTLHSRPGEINPYSLGFSLLKDIEERWNKGKFGKEYDECDNLTKRKNWDKKLGLGREKIFEVREIENDLSLIENYLTPEFCEKNKLFAYNFDEDFKFLVQTDNFKDIKNNLLNMFTNAGQPIIKLIDANHENKYELYLKHDHTGIDLRKDYAVAVVKRLFKVWKRPVNLETRLSGKEIVLRSKNGKKVNLITRL